MIDPGEIVDELRLAGATAWFGVPDSVLTPIVDAVGTSHVTVCANEGAAVGSAVGWFLATGDSPVVFLQNSGLGNVVNPLMSVAHADIHGVPLVLVVGWRGAPSGPEEAFHHGPEGRVTEALLAATEVPVTLFDGASDVRLATRSAVSVATKERKPVGLLIPRGVLAPSTEERARYREGLEYDELYRRLIASMRTPTLFVGSAGYGSRSLAGVWPEPDPNGHARLAVGGGMGHSLAIAGAIADARPDRRVVVVQGDGATLMHLGTLAAAGAMRRPNLLTVVANNRCHESVGGAATAAPDLSYTEAGAALGFARTESARCASDIDRLGSAWDATGGAWLVEVALAPTTTVARRPVASPLDETDAVREWLAWN